jgi:undecaprenyl-diphosphatase
MTLFKDRSSWARRLEARVLLLFFGVAAALAACIHLASEAAEGNGVPLDRWLLLRLRDDVDPNMAVGPQWLLRTMVDFTALGGGAVLTLVTLLAAGYLLAKRKSSLAMFLASSIAAGGILNTVLKSIFVRDRPDVVPHLVEVSSASFPSGHAMNSAMVYLTLAALLVSAERSRRVRIFLLAAAILLTLIVGFSRMYLGVHWPTDVLAGWAVGAAWAVACSLVAGILQHRHAVEGPERERGSET